MSIGMLRHQVSLQSPTNTTDTGGGAVKTWTTLAKLWANISRSVGRKSTDKVKYKKQQLIT